MTVTGRHPVRNDDRGALAGRQDPAVTQALLPLLHELAGDQDPASWKWRPVSHRCKQHHPGGLGIALQLLYRPLM